MDTTTQKTKKSKEESKSYVVFLRPPKFWQRSNKMDASPEQESAENIIIEPKTKPNKFSLPFPSTSLSLHKKSLTAKEPKVIPLCETAKGQVYKLSIVNDSGIYLPPSPAEESKRDHWLDVDEESLTFRIPSHDCLTTSSGKHSFYTPSVASRGSWSSTPLSSTPDSNN